MLSSVVILGIGITNGLIGYHGIVFGRSISNSEVYDFHIQKISIFALTNEIDRAVVVVGAQIVGGLAAAGVVKYLIPGAREVDFAVSLSTGTSVLRGLFLEMFFTAELVFTILMLAAEVS